jgi:hypothetical protein
MRPGATAAAAPPSWPLADPRVSEHFSLVMTLHPQCPCSRASLDELQSILARANRPVDVRILFVVPQGAPEDWLDSPTSSLARSIPGAHVVIDTAGQRATLLGATTSGEVFLYTPDGKLCFHGGITDGRGHEGDNPGMICVEDILCDRVPTTARTPVYGCELGLNDSPLRHRSKQ